jgi:hypothetical protein
VLILTFILLFAGISLAQNPNIEQYQFISPLPDSKLIMPESNIIIRQGDIIDPGTIKEASIEVVGSKSGVHSGEFFLSDDLRTLIFKPFIYLTPGEKVNVTLYSGIYTASREMLGPITFDFYISQTISENAYEKALHEVSDFPISNASTKYENNFLKNNKYVNDDLPEDFPTITVNVNNNPSDGFLFIAPYSRDGNINYLSILDNNAVPIFYKRMPYASYDFKIQQNGLLTYGVARKHIYYAMDSSYALVDSFATGNGYLTNHHDLQIIDNGHSLLLSYDPQPVRMDTIVPGGDSSATVIGLIIQELDETKNVIFQWRSWDYFNITDATEDIDLTQHTIDYVHGNAIELDNDGNILLSSRHLDEVTKIHRQTGEIIWRWGGIKSKNNEFMFVNDPITFSHQHDIRRLDNGNITLFDNGSLHYEKESRAIEYELDEENKIATRIWSFNHQTPIYKRAMGNVQRLDNESTIIGWGGWFNDDDRTITEIDSNNEIKLEFLMPDNFLSYRAFKFNWRTNLFIVDVESMDFGLVDVGDSSIKLIELRNPKDEAVIINEIILTESVFSVLDILPLIIPPHKSIRLSLMFKPSTNGYFTDTLNIRSVNNTLLIGQQVVLIGGTDVVPVELTSFTAVHNNNQIILNWSTATEINNHGFEVERKTGDGIYLRIGFVTGHATTTEIQNYSFVDSKIASGIYTYRLKQIDFDGSFKYSSEVDLTITTEFALEQNYPNPYYILNTI